MNKNKLAPCIAFLLLTLFFGCSDFIDSFETEVNKAPEGMGYLSIRIDGAESSRTIMPTMPAAASLYYKLEFFVSGELTATKTDIVSYTDLSVPILLEAKTWDIAVSAYKDLAGTQIVTTREKITGIVITNSHITTVDVHLKPITEAGGGSGQGIFKLNIDYPGTVDFASMAFEKTTGGPVTTYYFTGGSPLIGKDASIEMDTGYYFVTFNLKIGVETLERKEILHIYQNLESVYNHTFTLSSFFATVTEITVAPESKSTYVIDEPLDLYVYAVYSDYTKSLISGGITTNYLSDTPGAQNITITHTDTGLQTTFAVTLLGYAAKIGSNNYPTLYQAVNDLAALTGNAASPTEIVILRDITAPENGMTAATGYTVPNGKHIKLTVESGNLIITASAGDFHLFSVTNTVSASSLTLGPTSGGGTLKLNGGNEAAQPNRNGVYVYYASNNGSSFTMNNGVTITGFKSSSIYGGGGVYLNNGTFTMEGGEISGNTATTTGGGVYSNYSFTMKGGKISGNTATTTGGGVYMTSSASSFSMMNSCEISDNTATGNGGGVYLNGGTFTMDNSGKISGNKAVSGGGVFVNSGTFDMSGGTIGGTATDKNSATSSGGGVYINGGTFTMSGTSKISGNTTTASGGGVYVAASGTFDMSGGTIGGTATDKNSATSSGGGVYVASGKFTMRGTAKISGNTANTFGGGVYVAGTSTGTNDNFTMSDNTQITGNTAPSGGGVYISTDGKFTMSGGTIGGTAASDKNTATSNGGGVCIDGTSGTFKMTGGIISGNTANASGGGVSTNNGTFEMSAGEISGNNTAGSTNGGGGVNVGSNGKFTLSGSGKISGNTAPNGGGVYAASDGTNYFTMSGGEISGNNSTSNGGGGVYKAGTGTFTMSGGTIGGDTPAQKNSATNYGGGVYVAGNGSFTMNGTAQIIGNEATNNGGGGVYKAGTGTFSMSDNAEISANTATNTSGSVNGGGVYVTAGTFNMSGGTISANKLTCSTSSGYSSQGCGVSVTGGTFNMSDGTISNNTHTDTDNSSSGGGVYFSGSAFNMSGGTINNNVAINGGGMYCYGTFTISGSAKIKSNRSYNPKTNSSGTGGGGVFMGGGNNFTMNGGEISGNTADSRSQSGGGVCVFSGTFTMTGGEISGNTALSTGGGVDIPTAGTFKMTGGEISGNTAKYNGGGVCLSASYAGTINMTGGKISDNTSQFNGGGVYVNAQGTFTMSGGYVYGTDGASYTPTGTPNKAGSGISVYVYSGGTANYSGAYGADTITTTNNTLPDFPIFTTAAELDTFLTNKGNNTTSTSYKVKMNVTDISEFVPINIVLLANANKYVSIDFTDSTITSIPEYAFYDLNNLINVIIGNSITSIGYCAFGENGNLTSIQIPSSVTSLGAQFSYCENLTAINVDAANTVYSSQDGVLYNKTKTSLIKYPEGKTDTSFIIPDSVTSIEGVVFLECPYLASVTIPNTVTSIGQSAFSCCSSLTSINIPNSVINLADNAFNRCTSLTSVTIGSGVTNIKVATFTACSSLTSITIPNTVTSIESIAFSGCTNLITVIFQGTIPSSDFNDSSAFPGDLRDKFYAGNSTNGVPGTYTRPDGTNLTWTKM